MRVNVRITVEFEIDPEDYPRATAGNAVKKLAAGISVRHNEGQKYEWVRTSTAFDSSGWEIAEDISGG